MMFNMNSEWPAQYSPIVEKMNYTDDGDDARDGRYDDDDDNVIFRDATTWFNIGLKYCVFLSQSR